MKVRERGGKKARGYGFVVVGEASAVAGFFATRKAAERGAAVAMRDGGDVVQFAEVWPARECLAFLSLFPDGQLPEGLAGPNERRRAELAAVLG